MHTQSTWLLTKQNQELFTTTLHAGVFAFEVNNQKRFFIAYALIVRQQK